MQHLYAVEYDVAYNCKDGKRWRKAWFNGEVNVIANGDAVKAVAKAKKVVLAQRGWKGDNKVQWKPVQFRMTSVHQGQNIACPAE